MTAHRRQVEETIDIVREVSDIRFSIVFCLSQLNLV